MSEQPVSPTPEASPTIRLAEREATPAPSQEAAMLMRTFKVSQREAEMLRLVGSFAQSVANQDAKNMKALATKVARAILGKSPSPFVVSLLIPTE